MCIGGAFILAAGTDRPVAVRLFGSAPRRISFLSGGSMMVSKATAISNDDLAAEVEAWLDQHWDEQNRREKGTDRLDVKSWLGNCWMPAIRCRPGRPTGSGGDIAASRRA